MRLADRDVLGGILARQREAEHRANDVIERIEKGGVNARPLPSLREDSMASMESMPSMESSPSSQSDSDTTTLESGDSEDYNGPAEESQQDEAQE